MSATVKKGDVLHYRGDPRQTARVCRVTPYNVLLCVNTTFYSIPLRNVESTFLPPYDVEAQDAEAGTK